MLTLLTATGCRPQAWAICEQLMARQTYQGEVHWIIVDDGPVPQPMTFTREGWRISVVYPEKKWKRGDNTQARNLAQGLHYVEPGDNLLIIEDDDYYAPDYLTIMSELLADAELVGITPAVYYNIATGKSKVMSNQSHSSLCSTGMKGEAILAFKQIVTGLADKFIDIQLWKNPLKKKLVKRPDLCVGIKGMPGRSGIGCGHKDNFGKPGKPLRDLIGKGAELYET